MLLLGIVLVVTLAGMFVAWFFHREMQHGVKPISIHRKIEEFERGESS